MTELYIFQLKKQNREKGTQGAEQCMKLGKKKKKTLLETTIIIKL